jgi:hypothetical protein
MVRAVSPVVVIGIVLYYLGHMPSMSQQKQQQQLGEAQQQEREQ